MYKSIIFLVLIFNTSTFSQEEKDYYDHWNEPNKEKMTLFLNKVISSTINEKNCHRNERLFSSCIKSINSIAYDASESKIQFNHHESSPFITIKKTPTLKANTSLEQIKAERLAYDKKIINFYNHLISKKSTIPIEEIVFPLIDQIEERKMNGVLGSAHNAFLKSSTNDPYTSIRPASLSKIKGGNSFYGIDFELQKKKEGLLITEILGGGNATQAGLTRGDIITSIHNISVVNTQEDLSDIVSRIKGPEGTKIQLKIKEKGIISVERKKIEIKNIQSKMLSQKIGYLRYRAFESQDSSKIEESIEDLKSQGMKKLIFDLRNNGGGSVVGAGEIIDLFIEKDQIVYSLDFLDERKANYTKYSKKEKIFDGEVILLINRNSGSASEIFAGAIQDYNRAIILGETSFGKGIIQERAPIFINDLTFSETQAYSLNPKGRSPQSIGIIPDIEILDPFLKDIEAYRSNDVENSLKPNYFPIQREEAYLEKIQGIKDCLDGSFETSEKDDDQLNAAIYIMEKCY